VWPRWILLAFTRRAVGSMTGVQARARAENGDTTLLMAGVCLLPPARQCGSPSRSPWVMRRLVICRTCPAVNCLCQSRFVFRLVCTLPILAINAFVWTALDDPVTYNTLPSNLHNTSPLPLSPLCTSPTGHYGPWRTAENPATVQMQTGAFICVPIHTSIYLSNRTTHTHLDTQPPPCHQQANASLLLTFLDRGGSVSTAAVIMPLTSPRTAASHMGILSAAPSAHDTHVACLSREQHAGDSRAPRQHTHSLLCAFALIPYITYLTLLTACPPPQAAIQTTNRGDVDQGLASLHRVPGVLDALGNPGCHLHPYPALLSLHGTGIHPRAQGQCHTCLHACCCIRAYIHAVHVCMCV
jgi:hypothetical protein